MKQLKGDEDNKLALMLILAEKNSYARTQTVREYIAASDETSTANAYKLFKRACVAADFKKEVPHKLCRYLDQLDKAMTKAVNEYEKTGRNVRDVVELGTLFKNVLETYAKVEDKVPSPQGPRTAIQTNINMDAQGLAAVIKDIKNTSVELPVVDAE